MINKNTEVIFIDEASSATLDVDDWKIITQGGYTACDVKYRTAKSFYNRCPMFMTAQKKLEFQPEDQPAMDRRIRYYMFKSLPSPKKKAAQWLRKHPMECIAWAASKARVVSDEEESSDDEEGEQESQNDDGILPESEKEILRTPPLGDLLAEPRSREESSEEDTIQDVGDSDEDETITTLKVTLAQCSPDSLRHRQLSHILETRLEEKERQKELEEMRYEKRQQHLLSRGVSTDHVSLLPHDQNEPLPTPIRKELAAFEEQLLEKERENRKKRAKKVFESQWLQATENELQDCMVALRTSLDTDMKASMNAYRELLQDKLRSHHRNLGTLGCVEALAERKRVCRELGLLQEKDQDSVFSLYEPLPTARVEEGDDNSILITQNTPPHVPQCDEEDDIELFNTRKTPTYVPKHGEVEFCVPSPGIASQTMQHGGLSETSHSSSGAWRSEFLDDCAKSDQLLRAHSTKRRQEPTRSQTQTKRPKNTIDSYYSKK